MINKIKDNLKEEQEKYIEEDRFNVLLGLFIMSVSFLTLQLIPEIFIILTFLAGTGITMIGLIPIIMRVIHKVLKTLWDSKWYVSITIPAFFMSLVLSVISLIDVNIPFLYVFAKFVLMFGIIWLSLYLIIKVAVIIHIEEEKGKSINEKKELTRNNI
ncbi:hypothetical protein L3496_23330 [Klebsiella pneumoniae]|uniref:hypothetical protein n=1 Tax=Klebsiella pneumoniae TaxID=573 RepID=UPI0017A7B9F8|nr:hypothetical protein [Klebsiella pneumoniae]EAV8610193.1 hypothetical protein [Salmonella enterica]EFM2911546.1 hypothetical protein [Salmonella enterica subsp. enterica serovar Infantis]EIF8342446.1 hypothetical protein [Salmonella enterica subsp. enterica serovar Agona]EHG9294206.1 hypothetical protein [Salmonella enterica]MDG0022064.1 hypothetical protein [Klebsiella pneumoniae]